MWTVRVIRAPRTIERVFLGGPITALAVAFGSVAGGAAQEPFMADSPPMPEAEYHMDPPGVHVEDWVTGLEVVWGIRFLPDRRALVTERAGRVRVVSPAGELQDEPWAAPDSVFHNGGGGMMGLDLHPDFADEPWVYAMYPLSTDDGPVNRVVRWRDEGARGAGMEVILDDLPAANTHNGGRIAFGPDGMLYVTIGDTGDAERAQDLDDLRGSLLRVTPLGEVPDDNPWPGSPIWAYGSRNAQGIAFHPETGALLVADHGPQARDQIHVVERGKNYGWPHVLGTAGVEGYEDPLLEWDPAAPPGDLTFHNDELWFSTLRSQALIRIVFQDATEPYRVIHMERWFAPRNLGDSPMGESESRLGRRRALAVGPDGALYLGTSNRDRGRGVFREGDDRIVRSVPR